MVDISKGAVYDFSKGAICPHCRKRGAFAASCGYKVFHQNNLLLNQSGFANLAFENNSLYGSRGKQKTSIWIVRIDWNFFFPSRWQACHTCRCISNGTECVKAI